MFPSSVARVLVPFFRSLAILGVLTVSAGVAQNPIVADIDRSVKPGDDFYRYANGAWLNATTIPEGQSSYDTRAVLTRRTSERVRLVIEEAAASRAMKGNVAHQVGDYYASFMNEDAIEAKGPASLSRELAKIAAIADKSSLSAYLGTTLNTESDGLTANADHIFGLWVNQGFDDAQHTLPHLFQGGVGLPGRDDYLNPSPEKESGRKRYQAHIAAMLKLANIADPENKAAKILSLETRIAQSFAPDEDAADVFKQNNPWKRADFPVKAQGMDWDAYLKAAGLEQQNNFVVWQPSAIIGVSALVASEDLESWKDYLRFHLVEHYAEALPRAFRNEHSAFNGGTASGSDRERVAVAATNAALGKAVGLLYTQRYFPPDAKAKAEAMVRDLKEAFHTRISNLAWMSPQSKAKALAKLEALHVSVGYPDQWIDYSTLEVVRDDAFGNMLRAEAFNRQRNLALLQKPPNQAEWRMDVQVVGAVIVFSPNSEFFSAAILQPPYFDPHGDNASNYGSAGAGMAHEISHSFDELGNIYDAQGRLGQWWTAEDTAQYHTAISRLAAQLDGYCPLAGACLKGKQVVGESSSDLAGLLVAHDAYLLSLKGKPDVVIGGLTGEQRFFLAFAQRWRKAQTEAALRQQIAGDNHPPGEFRSDIVRNVDAWYKAFDIAPTDKLYLKPEDRVRIW